MLKAKDFRKYAREALAGRWLKAGVVGLVAGFLGGALRVLVPAASFSSSAETDSLGDGLASMLELNAALIAEFMGVALVVFLWVLVIVIIGGATTLGYAKYNLNLVDDEDPRIGDLFSQYDRLGTGFGMQFLRGLYILLWTLLFVIPGMVAAYSYSMTPFILCENPEMTAREAIRESKKLMRGNKWRLFCLELSFYGWYILAAIILWVMMMVAIVPTAVIGSSIDTTATLLMAVVIGMVVLIIFGIAYGLVLPPYVTASMAVFYREISEGRYSAPEVQVEAVDYIYETVPEDGAH